VGLIWERVLGQERVRKLLSAAAADPGGTYLFIGPAGVGKVSAARVFAAAALCKDQCGECSSCTRALKGMHPDVVWFQPEGATHRVAAIRELVAQAALSPIEADRRVIIVEEADKIVERSQNALLKALEEPAASVTWILVANALEPFLPTILSRCQIVEFATIPEATVAHLVSDRFEVTDEEASLIVRSARGDLGRAIALAGDESHRQLRERAFAAATARGEEPRWALATGEEVQQAAAEAKDRVRGDQKAELAHLIEIHGDGPWRRRLADRHKRALRAAETGVYSTFLIWLGYAFRDLAAISAGDDSTIVDRDHAARIVEAAPERSTSFWLDMAEAAVDGDLAVKENAFGPLVVESVLLRLVPSSGT
jgi:DNA polymerase-3 subunit delta'